MDKIDIVELLGIYFPLKNNSVINLQTQYEGYFYTPLLWAWYTYWKNLNPLN